MSSSFVSNGIKQRIRGVVLTNDEHAQCDKVNALFNRLFRGLVVGVDFDLCLNFRLDLRRDLVLSRHDEDLGKLALR